jgi:hypothetical protein
MFPRSKHLKPLTLAAALFAAAAITVTPSSAFATPDEDAQALYDDAMDNDYLNVKFDDAIAKLNKAVKQCGKKCTKPMLGKIQVAIAVVQGAGKSDMKAAKAAFEKAFKFDKNVKPLTDYFTDDLKKLFEAARKAAGGGEPEEVPVEPPVKAKPSEGGEESSEAEKPKTEGEESSSEGDAEEPPKKKKKKKADDEAEETAASGSSVDWTPPKEARANTPLPIFIPVEEGLGAASAKLRYKPFGETKWLAVSMKKMEGGFGAVIPCAQTTTTGKLKLYIFLKDTEGEPVAQAGSSKAPLEVSIKNKISGDQPSLPGEEPPEKCSSVECPPDFPGCGGAAAAASGGDRGDKGWGASCEKTQECKAGFACVNGSCEQGEEPGPTSGGESGGDGAEGGDNNDGESGSSKSKSGNVALPNHLVTAGVQLDMLFLASADDVCGSVNAAGELTTYENYACFNPDGSGEFLGKPVPGQFNQVRGGAAFGDARLLVGYDLNFGLVSPSLRGLAVGARVGAAIGGSPSVGDSADRFFNCTQQHPDADPSTPDVYEGFCRQNAASDFMRVHAELQVKWFPMEMLAPPKSLYAPRPYIFTGFGVGQVNAGVPVDVCDTVDANGNAVDPSTVSPEDAARCGTNPAAVRREGIESYQITGLNFIPLGVGAIVPVHKNIGINLELKTMFMVPTSGVVFAPFIGPVGMF